MGAATNPLDKALLAFSWKESAMTNLGTLNGSAADAVNSKGQVVGGSGFYDVVFFPHALTRSNMQSSGKRARFLI